MHSELICIPCVLRQIQRVVSAARTNDKTRANGKALAAGKQALAVLENLSLDEPPSSFTSRVIISVYQFLGNTDPFRYEKLRQNRLGRSFALKAKKAIQKSKDPLRTVLLYAAAGNIIDVGTQDNIDLHGALQKAQAERFAIDHYPVFKKQLKTARTILYIVDNAGEIYFDLLFLELLKNYDITVAAKRSPILNDATRAEVAKLGLDHTVTVIDTGSGFLGIDFAILSESFKTAYDNSDLIIAKGHANFESLVDRDRPAFFLLKAKCPVVAQKLDVSVGDSVFFHYAP